MQYRYTSYSLVFLFILLGIFAGGGCARKLVEPEFKGVSGFKVNRQNELKKIQYEFDLTIFNPNKTKVSLLNYDLDVSINGHEIGKAIGTDKITIKKLTEEKIHFVVVSSVAQTVNGFVGLLGNFFKGDKKINLGVSGTVKARARGISKKAYIKEKLPLKIDF